MTSPFNLLACPLDGINLIEASAGTGKTFNICGMYLRLLLERKLEVKQILVVTFTITATAELRERIRSRIAEALNYAANNAPTAPPSTSARRSAGDATLPSPLGRRVGDEGARHEEPPSPSTDPFIPQLIDSLLQQHGYTPTQLTNRLDLALQTFDEASIFTIHGFCQRALADTAFAAGLPFEFELMTDDNEIIVEAVNDFWRRRIAGADFSPALASYMMEKRDTPQSFAKLLARHQAKPLARCIWPAALDQSQSEPVDIAALEVAYDAARTAWNTDRDAVHAQLTKQRSALHANVYNDKSLPKAVAAWDRYFLGANPIATLDDKAPLFCASHLALKTKKGYSTPTHGFCDRVDALLGLQTAARNALALARLRLLRSLIDEVGADLPRRKRERRVIAFNDMLSNLHAALHNQDYPWLAESLRGRFPAALIDEFQDTDPLQFAIFDAIYGDGEGSLFLVGDPKQAIYSFRNADLYTYLEARQKAGAQYTLSENQRSTPGLISAVNGLFERNARAFMLPDLGYQSFSPGKRTREPFNDKSPHASLPRPDLHVWMLPGSPIHRSVVRERAVQATAAEIARLLTESRASHIFIGDKPLHPKDVAILVRSHAQGSDLKRELAKLNIGSVELLQESVYASVDAEEVERVLMAINEPSRLTLLRGALATEMIGCDAAAIVALSADESQLLARIESFAARRDAWVHQGLGVMFRQLLTDEGASARLLCRPDGERRLTNLLHLGEELHKAAQIHDTPDALLRWLHSQRNEASTAEATQLRLESDQNLVQIATIHKAKGLEWPIVFCPFLWDGFLLPRRTVMDSKEYHDAGGDAVIDFRTGEEYQPHEGAVRAQMKLEDSAELLRLAYVALTRGVYRCYLVAGTYGTHANLSTSQSCGSLLNWLVAGNGETPETWFEGKREPADIAAAWTALAKARHPHIQLIPLPDAAGKPVALERPAPDSLIALTPPARIANAWRMSSFSGLANGAVNEAAA
ncbi:MAG: UvrD-helicase domain-containing protein, partial [Vicinamibacterales bacterium]